MNVAMRHFPMATDTLPLTQLGGTDKRKQLLMALNAVSLNDMLGLSGGPNDLRLQPKRKHCRMAKAITHFKGILLQNRIVRYMAIVAGGYSSMAAPLPGGKLRHHNMAVNTGSGIIREIRGSSGDVDNKKTGSYSKTQHNKNGHLPEPRHKIQRQQATNDFEELVVILLCFHGSAHSPVSLL